MVGWYFGMSIEFQFPTFLWPEEIHDDEQMKSIEQLNCKIQSFLSRFRIQFRTEPDCNLMTAVATDNGSLLIYQNSTLVWCTQLMDETIAISRGNFNGLAGGIVTLNMTGHVDVGYLGSDPHVFKVS